MVKICNDFEEVCNCRGSLGIPRLGMTIGEKLGDRDKSTFFQ